MARRVGIVTARRNATGPRGKRFQTQRRGEGYRAPARCSHAALSGYCKVAACDHAAAPVGLARGRRYDSRRFFHERSGDPLPAYVVAGYVVEKSRRDWNHRVAGQTAAAWAGPKEWWEVRRQGSNTLPGVSIGRHPLFTADTLRDCLAWIEAQTDAVPARA